MAKIKRTKGFEAKIATQISGIATFQAETVTGDVVTFNDLYKVDRNSDDDVNLELIFINSGVIVSSDVFIDKIIKIQGIRGSIGKTPIGTCQDVHGKFLDIISVVSVSNITPIPDDLNIRLIITGGPNSLIRQVGKTVKLTAVGQNIDVVISIIFF